MLTWDDVLKRKARGSTITWFAALVMMATFLNKLGLIAWFSGVLESSISGLGLSWVFRLCLVAVGLSLFALMFASGTAHVTAMFGAFYAAGLALGAPPLLYALMMAAATSIMMTLTHYASGSSPVIYGSGYVEHERMVESRLYHERDRIGDFLHHRRSLVESAGLLVSTAPLSKTGI